MIVEIGEGRIGHAPKHATCTQNVDFSFDEKILTGIPFDVSNSVINSGGQLPVDLAQKVARDGCPNFDGGECKLLNGRVCTL